MNNVFSTLASALGSIAPTLATMLGGPLAGTAVGALVNAFGLPATATVTDITKVVQTGAMTPEIIARVREADQQHAEKLKQMEIDVLALNQKHAEAFAADEVADRSSARAREVAVRDWTPAALAWLVIIGSIALAAMVVTGNVTKDPTLAVQVGVVIGYVFNEAKAVLGYYFGSSRGSDEKSRDLADIAKSG